MRRLIQGYELGNYTGLEIAGQVLDVITDQNASEILATLPDVVRSHLLDSAAEAPHTEQQWSEFRLVTLNGNPQPISEYRAAIEVIRAHLMPREQ
jgi:hypothetical protein